MDKKNNVPLAHRASLASRLASTSGEVKGISRKEFKPTIPTRRKKQPGSQPKQDLPAGSTDQASSISVSSDNSERFKNRIVNPKQKDGGGKKGKSFRKEYVRASTGLFGETETKFDIGEDPFSSERTIAELEEEKNADPFRESSNEMTPVTLPINPRIECKSKLSVGKKQETTEEGTHDTSIVELLNRTVDDTTESTYLINLPDVLPIPTEKQEAHDIHSLPEGFLGRLQLLRSGKARLMIGDVPFDVEINSKSGFLQEVLCSQTESMSKGMLANLGTVPYSISVTPNLENIT